MSPVGKVVEFTNQLTINVAGTQTVATTCNIKKRKCCDMILDQRQGH